MNCLAILIQHGLLATTQQRLRRTARLLKLLYVELEIKVPPQGG
jgi:hypothetical protein